MYQEIWVQDPFVNYIRKERPTDLLNLKKTNTHKREISKILVLSAKKRKLIQAIVKNRKLMVIKEIV